MGELLQAVKENVEFLLLCLLIFLALFFVAMLPENAEGSEQDPPHGLYCHFFCTGGGADVL